MSNIRDQYRIIAGETEGAGAGWADRSGRGRVRLQGKDVVAFLQGLVSNDLTNLERGGGAYATYLTPQGRMIADLRLYHRGECVLADVAPGTGEELAGRLDQLIFAEDVQPEDATDDFGQTRVIGSAVGEVISRALGVDAGALGVLETWDQLDGADGIFVVRTDDAALPSYDVFGPAASHAAVRIALESAGAIAMSPELVESLRVDVGRPLFGVDMTDQTIPLEAGLLERAISTGKGCYVGQEVIIRVLHRGGGRVAKRLVKLAFDPGVNDMPAVGAVLHDDGKDVGRLTTVARTLDDTAWMALGYVHRDSAEAGRQLVAGDQSVPAVIAGLAG